MHFEPATRNTKGDPVMDAFTTERILRALASLVARAEEDARQSRPRIPREGVPDVAEVETYAKLLRRAKLFEEAFTRATEVTAGEGLYVPGVPHAFSRNLLRTARELFTKKDDPK